jgi:RHS repeat-associated protein
VGQGRIGSFVRWSYGRHASNMTLGSVTASMPAAPTSFSGTTGYSHDTKLQLTNETSTRGGGYNFSNSFDSAGNATTFKGGSNSFTSSNQNTAWTFDGNGNPTTYASHTLTFDAEDRMTAYSSVMTAGYCADGLRAWKTTSAGTTYYLYDGGQAVEELDGSGVKSAVMTFGPHGVLARTTASRTLLYTTDALGQMAQQIDASTGNIIASYLFDAWGARQVSTSDPTAASDPYSGYNTAAGYVTDWETGLQLLGHRYYDPATGRFLNRDPISMAGGVNVYVYVANQPMGQSDPNGTRRGSGSGGGMLAGP